MRASTGDHSIFNRTQHLGTEGAELIKELDLNDVNSTDGFIALIVIVGLAVLISICCAKIQAMQRREELRDMALLQTEEERTERSGGVFEGMLTQFLSKKLGLTEGQNLKTCLQNWKAQGPSLLKTAGFNPKQFRKALKDAKKHPQQQMQLIWTALQIFLATHGTVIASKGLEGIGLEACGQVICSGDLRYQSGPTGHFCDWNCPAGMTPAAFDFIPAENIASKASEVNEKLFEKYEDQLETKKGWQVMNKIPFLKGVADSAAPLVLLKGDTFHLDPKAVLYRGRCAETS